MTKEEFKARVSELVCIDPWEDFLESMWDLCNEVNDKDNADGTLRTQVIVRE